ncbi:MAG: DUF3899 domain-containing protein [Clostridia bacterium]|nr:DUF3899 domain-containing protein [Clostridia bacterium]
MKKWLEYLIISVLSLAAVLCVLFMQDSFQHSGELLLKDLCNAFFVPGAVVLGIGLLIWTANGGTFDMIAFGVIKLFDLLKRDMTKVKYKTFYDYRQAQQDKKRSFTAYLIIGAVLMVIAVIFLILYNNQ